MKKLNRTGQNDIVELCKLQHNFVFKPIDGFMQVIQVFVNELKEYVGIHNEYLLYKQLEEKARAKKQKVSSSVQTKKFD